MLMLGIGSVAAFLTASTVVWKFVRFIFRVDRALPTLIKIAEQFEANGGASLKDRMDNIDKTLKEQDVQARIAVGLAEDSRLIANTNAKIVEELTSTQTTELLHFREYLHDKMHEINNNLNRQQGLTMMTDAKVVRIEDRLDGMMPLISRHREGDSSE